MDDHNQGIFISKLELIFQSPKKGRGDFLPLLPL